MIFYKSENAKVNLKEMDGHEFIDLLLVDIQVANDIFVAKYGRPLMLCVEDLTT